MLFKHLLVASLLVSCCTLAQEITENSEQIVKSEENNEEIKRQGPQQAGWGGLISGKFSKYRWSTTNFVPLHWRNF